MDSSDELAACIVASTFLSRCESCDKKQPLFALIVINQWITTLAKNTVLKHCVVRLPAVSFPLNL